MIKPRIISIELLKPSDRVSKKPVFASYEPDVSNMQVLIVPGLEM